LEDIVGLHVMVLMEGS